MSIYNYKMDGPTHATPIYSHLSQYKDVYKPAEDSFLLMDALEKEKDFLQQLRHVFNI